MASRQVSSSKSQLIYYLKVNGGQRTLISITKLALLYDIIVGNALQLGVLFGRELHDIHGDSVKIRLFALQQQQVDGSLLVNSDGILRVSGEGSVILATSGSLLSPLTIDHS
jgi:hypothetical protein